MMYGDNARNLAGLIYDAARNKSEKRLVFEVHPNRMWAVERQRPAAVVPMLTSHGGCEQLADLIHTFNQWSQPIHIGLLSAEGLFQFWVEADT
jgi:hypothetical protein